MNPRIKPARSAARYPVAAYEGETQITGFPGDLQDLFNVGTGEFIELERVSLASLISLQSCAIDVCRNTFIFPLFVAPWLETVTKSLRSCLELQMNWLDVMMPRASCKTIDTVGKQDPPDPENEETDYVEDYVVETFENY